MDTYARARGDSIMRLNKIESTDLTLVETSRLKECEQVIKAGVEAFCAVGDALTEIRDSKLYRASHGTFEAYCKDKWQLSRTRAYELLDQAVVFNALQVANGLSDASDISARDVKAIKPHLAEVTEEIHEKVSQGADPVTTTYEVIKAKRAEIKKEKEPDIEPEPEFVKPDPWKEFEAACKQIRDLETLVESLSKDDTAKELAAWQQRYVQLEGRLGQQMTTANQAQNSAQYYADTLKKIRKALNVEKTTEVLPRIQQLIAEVRAVIVDQC